MPAGQAHREARSRHQLKRPRENEEMPYQAAGRTARISVTDKIFKGGT